MKHELEGKSLPTFLGIGSMRCGSTWLYEVLKCHPDIQVSDSKEVQFFFMRRMLHYDFHWYEALFEPRGGGEVKKCCGEISPQYARLRSWQVKRIAQFLPNLRLILILRHPIERLWSQTLFDFGRLQGRDIRHVHVTEILRQLERARSRLSSDYARTVEIWSDAFGRDALHIGFFDQLRDDPQSYVDSVLEHIGASTPWRLPQKFVNNKVWATESLVKHEREMSEMVLWYMADQLLKPTERLNELLDGRVSHWVEEIRQICGNSRLSWRILKSLNRAFLTAPEKLAHRIYYVALDGRFYYRWRKLLKSYRLSLSEEYKERQAVGM